MKYPEPAQLCRDLARLIGTRIVRLSRVVVWVDGERLELLDSLLIDAARDDRTMTLQVSSDGQRQHSACVFDGKYSIQGEWSDRDREEHVTTNEALVPFVADTIHAVWDADLQTEQEMLIGLLIGGDSRTETRGRPPTLGTRRPADAKRNGTWDSNRAALARAPTLALALTLARALDRATPPYDKRPHAPSSKSEAKAAPHHRAPSRQWNTEDESYTQRAAQ